MVKILIFSVESTRYCHQWNKEEFLGGTSETGDRTFIPSLPCALASSSVALDKFCHLSEGHAL